MITGIKINNFLSIDNCDISFEKAKYKFLNQFNIDNKIANPIAIYGRNGSGKSSFLEAFFNIVSLLTSDNDKLGPLFPNFLNKKNKPSSITLYFEYKGNNYEYLIKTNLEKILEERLFKDEKIILDREDSKYIYDNQEYFINSNFYSALRDCSNKFHNSLINDVYEFLANIVCIGDDKNKYMARSLNNMSRQDAMVIRSNEVKKILKKYKSFPIYDVKSYIDENTRNKEYYVSIETNNSSFNIPFYCASSGMKSQSFMLSVLTSLPENGVMVVDELEDGLHPLTLMNFINEAIEKNIQLIFVGHNTNALSQLRPDNIVFANWKNGYSTYKRLCDIYPNIREINNIEKMYLSNVFDKEIEK